MMISADSSRARNNSLEFVAAPALAPAEVSVDPALMEQYRKELAAVSSPCSTSEHFPDISLLQAEAVPLPEEDDDL